MTKEEKTRVEVRSENGVEVKYVCSPVRQGKPPMQVGYAPRRKMVDLDEMLGVLTPEKIYSLADRQLDQDTKNAVRAKFTKDKVKASSVVDALAKGTILVEEVNAVVKAQGLTFTDAAAALIGVGKNAKVEPYKIHWDILPAVEAVVVEEEVVEESDEVIEEIEE